MRCEPHTPGFSTTTLIRPSKMSNQIEFICAVGAHQVWDRSLLVKKLGADIVTKYPVYNHDPFLNCTYLGKTSFDTRVEISAEVMSCDLKVSIQSVVPHSSYGFSGGGKMVMPGWFIL